MKMLSSMLVIKHLMPLTSLAGKKKSMARQLFDYQHFLKYFLFCSTKERNSLRFGTTLGEVSEDNIFILGELSL